MPSNITLTDDQAHELPDVLLNHVDGDSVQVTQQEDGTIVLGFTVATVTIDKWGEVEEL